MLQIVAAILICAAPATRPVKYLDYRDAHKQVLKTGQPLVVLVSAEWCGPCQRMKRSLATANRDGLVDRFVVCLVDADKQPKLARQFMARGRGVPQLVVWRKHKGRWWRRRSVGYHSPAQIRAILKAVLEKTHAEKKRSGASGNPAVRSGRVPGAT